MDNRQEYPFCKILETIREVDEGGTSTDGSKNKKTLWNQTIKLKSHQMDNPQEYPFCKILETIREVDEGGTSTDGSENKKTNDDA